MATLLEQAQAVKSASASIALASTEQKNEALLRAAEALEVAAPHIVSANAADLADAEASNMAPSAQDRLRLDDKRLAAMAQGMRQIVSLPDPVGEITDGGVLPNGVRKRRVRVPLGVIAVIYENRPNVTSDIAALCIKSGNAVFLRGSSTAKRSNDAIVKALRAGIAAGGLTPDAITTVEDLSHEAAAKFMQLNGYIDCLMPRGGRSLVAAIREHATVPFIIDGDGNCHVYIDSAADLEIAERVVINAKTQRPGVCNAAESLVVHADIAQKFLPQISDAMPSVELVGDAQSREIVDRIGVATEEDFATEFLDLKMSVAVVSSLSDAIAHVNRYSSGHSEAIISDDIHTAARFTREVDAAAVVVNTSTRFVDGEQLGLGAELAISTQKLHARGPLGLRELTTLKYILEGNGQIRE